MNNMELYEKFREVPLNAQKTIGGGRLKGFTDINPMWRIKKLTEEFGPVGIGWKTTTDKEWTYECKNGEVMCFVDISLYVKEDGKWSDPIVGTGGSSIVSIEKDGKLYADNEGFKKAHTDALSVACKNLGMGADVYFAKDRTKYTAEASEWGLSPEKLNLAAAQRECSEARRKQGIPEEKIEDLAQKNFKKSWVQCTEIEVRSLTNWIQKQAKWSKDDADMYLAERSTMNAR